MIIYPIFVLLLLIPEFVNCQTDTEFWFAAPEITYELVSPSPVIIQNLDRPIKLYLTTYQGPALVTIDQPANSSFIPIQVTVQTDITQEVDLTPFIDKIENKPANTILNYGLRIRSTQPVNAVYEVQSPDNGEAFSLKGKNALGYEFIIPSQTHFQNHPYANPPARNSFVVVATEDSTVVTISPAAAIEGHIANDTFSLQLNQGQTYCARAISGDSTAHLGASFVYSSKPVAITVSDDAVFFPNIDSHSFDLTGDQLIPKNISSSNYILVGSANNPPLRDRVYIYAYEDSTAVSFNGTNAGTINKRESKELFMSENNSTAASIQANKPILVYHFWGIEASVLGVTHIQPTAVIVPPISCTGSRRVSLTKTPPETSSFQSFDFFLVTANGNQWDFTITGSPASIIDGSLFDTVPGTNSQWVYSEIGYGGTAWPVNQSRIISNSKGRFQVLTYNSDLFYFAKCAYFSDFSTLNLGPDKSICKGDSILLDAGFGRQSYLWSTGDTTQTLWVKHAGNYWVNTIENSCSLSDTIAISYYWSQPINLGPDRLICSGDSTLLNAGIGRVWYQWNTGETTQTIWVKNPGVYWVKAPDVHCTVFDSIEITITSTPNITNNPLSKIICSGESTNIPLTSDVTGTNFHWTASLTSGLVTGFSADSGLVINQTLLNSGTVPGSVTYHVIPKIGDCAGNPVNFLVTVTPGDSVKVAITSPVNSVCAGTPVTFTATSINGGITPIYQWKVNGVTAGANSPTYSYIPVTGDVVTCALTSSNTVCTSNNPTTSNSITMVVNPNLPVSISLSPSANPVCSGTLISYSATIINGGSPPQYQWKVNNLLVGSNSPNFSFTPVNGDIVKCELTSNALCATGSPATSGSITMAVIPVLSVNVNVSASSNPSCNGLPVTFTATPINGGTNPIYQWKVNATNAGINSSTFTYTPSNGDLVSCTLTSSETCTTNNPASSIQYPVSVSQPPIVTFTPCFDTITTDNAKPFKLKGGLPLGGTYSGPGVTPATSIFTPSTAGLGSKIITYSYTNAGLCSKTATASIVIRHASSVICGNPITDPRDNQVYPTTQIGTQCWLAANLNFGTEIPSTQHQVDNCIPEKYRNPASNIQYPASVYQWDELMKYDETPGNQGLCPPGWHVPTESDWTILFNSYTSNAFAGYPLTHSGFSGFIALLSGVQHMNETWDFNGFATFFWSSDKDGASRAWSHGMNSEDPSVSSYSASRANGFSVRCLKD